MNLAYVIDPEGRLQRPLAVFFSQHEDEDNAFLGSAAAGQTEEQMPQGATQQS